MKAAKVKSTSTIDAACFYTMRGSFPSAKQTELEAAVNSHEAVAEKFPGCFMFASNRLHSFVVVT